MSKEQELPALPPPPLWHDGVEFRGYTKTPGPGPWWTADCMREYARDAIAALASPAAEPVQPLPKGWAMDRFSAAGDGTRLVCVRNFESQLGQDFYEDRDPLIFAFLTALAEGVA